MTAWDVWTDGSTRPGAFAGRATAAPGGWCAVVEHGSDGDVLRGRVRDTTNVRMELVAAIMGLRAVPDGDPVTLHFDCTTILIVEYARLDDPARLRRGPDQELWRQLAAEYDRVDVALNLLSRGERPAQHVRAHVIAGAESKALRDGLPPDVTHPPAPRGAAKRARRKARVDAPRLVRDGMTHAPAGTEWLRNGRPMFSSGHRKDCSPVYGCVYGCQFHPTV